MSDASDRNRRQPSKRRPSSRQSTGRRIGSSRTQESDIQTYRRRKSERSSSGAAETARIPVISEEMLRREAARKAKSEGNRAYSSSRMNSTRRTSSEGRTPRNRADHGKRAPMSSTMKRKIERKKRRRRLRQIRALILVIILIIAAVMGVRAIKNKITGSSTKQENYDSEAQNKELEEIASTKSKNNSKKAAATPLKSEKNMPRVVRPLDNAVEAPDDGSPAKGEALNVIERDGKTDIHQNPSLESGVVETLNDHDIVDVEQVVAGGWLKVKTQSGKEGYAEAVRIKSDKLPPNDYNENSAENVLIVDQQLQNMKLYKGGKQILESAVSCGIDTEFTPRGVFFTNKLHSGEWDFAANFGEGYKYFTAFYTHGYLLHSLPMDQNQQVIRAEADKLGEPASHGCIRLPIPVAKYVYENVPDKSLLIIK